MCSDFKANWFSLEKTSVNVLQRNRTKTQYDLNKTRDLRIPVIWPQHNLANLLLHLIF